MTLQPPVAAAVSPDVFGDRLAVWASPLQPCVGEPSTVLTLDDVHVAVVTSDAVVVSTSGPSSPERVSIRALPRLWPRPHGPVTVGTVGDDVLAVRVDPDVSPDAPRGARVLVLERDGRVVLRVRAVSWFEVRLERPGGAPAAAAHVFATWMRFTDLARPADRALAAAVVASGLCAHCVPVAGFAQRVGLSHATRT